MKHPSDVSGTHVQDATPTSAFLDECVRVPLDCLTPLKASRPMVKNSMKYQQILAAVREVGLVEPPAVIPIPSEPDQYFILDGHLRIDALRELGRTHVDCLVATDDDTYSYNKRINRLSAVQEHKMIVRAMERGVSAERLGRALGLSPQTIRHRFRMLNGICKEAMALLVDTRAPAKVFDILRQMTPLRQIVTAELMVGNKNFSAMFANAMLAATPASQIVSNGKHGGGAEAVSSGSMARMERELAALQLQIKNVEDTYGPDVLHLTVIRGYLASLLANATVVRWLAKHQPEFLKEFQLITELEALPG